MAKAGDPAEWFAEATFEWPKGSGDIWTITLDNMALIYAERVIGQPMDQFLGRLQDAIKAKRPPMKSDLSGIIYGGLRNNHPEITEKFVVKMVLDEDPAMRNAIMEALAGVDIPERAMADVGNAPRAKGNRRQRRAGKKKTK